MGTDFSEPKRQSAAGVAVMFADHLQRSIRVLVFPIILLLVRAKGMNHWYLIAGFLVFLFILIIYSYLSYLRFSFFLDEEKQEFVIQKGVLSKEHISIRLDKIQQVNINQSLIQRIIGVYSLDIDTAGSDKKEASIKAIDHHTATILRERLLNRDTPDPTAEKSTDEQRLKSEPLLKLSTSTLFKVGLTSNYGASVALLMGFIFAIMEMLKNYTEAFQLEENPIKALSTEGLNMISIGVLLFFALLIVLGTNILRNFIKYFDFEVIKKKAVLAITSGLFEKKHTLLKPARVQISSYSQNYFQKKLDLMNMKFKQASFDAADEDDKDNKKHDIEIPGCDENERDELLKMIFECIPQKESTFIPNYRFLFLTIMLKVVIPIAFFLLIGWVLPHLRPYFWWIIPYAILVVIMLYFEFAHHRLYLSEDFIIKKSGIWDVEHQLMEPHKIQGITTKQYFWHKKANIGHLVLHTAAGTIHFKYGNYADIHRMANYWLYYIESGKKDWM
ncbi:putative membrane protein [Pedobacter steynii]|uniref:Putative membrane protein n=1 Tax=Pedobacter steynii TaxID=430522 RepID=A0A1G9S059_9SPHI|nr:PH domain-containing protein [Pedobacter steynii]NQX37586.1 PH domain-containing protein [Pedobacter steynii]SDM28881.1 putative membrane protein [Pedobacter steynii]